MEIINDFTDEQIKKIEEELGITISDKKFLINALNQLTKRERARERIGIFFDSLLKGLTFDAIAEGKKYSIQRVKKLYCEAQTQLKYGVKFQEVIVENGETSFDEYAHRADFFTGDLEASDAWNKIRYLANKAEIYSVEELKRKYTIEDIIGMLTEPSSETIKKIEGALNSLDKYKAEKEKRKEEIQTGTKLTEEDLSIPSLNCLKRKGIYTVEQLITYPLENLIHIRGLGRDCAIEIMVKLAEIKGIAVDSINTEVTDSELQKIAQKFLVRDLESAMYDYPSEFSVRFLKQLREKDPDKFGKVLALMQDREKEIIEEKTLKLIEKNEQLRSEIEECYKANEKVD